MTCEHDAMRIPCVTCGGTKEVQPPLWGHDAIGHGPTPCPDCGGDGHLSIADSLAIVAAVFDDGTDNVIALPTDDPKFKDWTEHFDSGVDATLDYLRSVRAEVTP